MITLKATSILLVKKFLVVVKIVLSILAIILGFIFMPCPGIYQDDDLDRISTARGAGGMVVAVSLLPFLIPETTFISQSCKSVIAVLILIVSPLPMLLTSILWFLLILCQLFTEMIRAWNVEVQDIKKGLTREKLPQEYLLRPSSKPIDEHLVIPSNVGKRIDEDNG